MSNVKLNNQTGKAPVSIPKVKNIYAQYTLAYKEYSSHITRSLNSSVMMCFLFPMSLPAIMVIHAPNIPLWAKILSGTLLVETIVAGVNMFLRERENNASLKNYIVALQAKEIQTRRFNGNRLTFSTRRLRTTQANQL